MGHYYTEMCCPNCKRIPCCCTRTSNKDRADKELVLAAKLAKSLSARTGFKPTNMAETPEQKARRIGVPLIPKQPPSLPVTMPNPVIAVCGECGLELHRTMGYCCPRSNCPCGMGPVTF